MKLSSIVSCFYGSEKDSKQKVSSQRGFSPAALSGVAIAAVGAGMTLARLCPSLKPQTVVAQATAVLAVGVIAKKLISHLSCFSSKSSIPRSWTDSNEFLQTAESSSDDVQHLGSPLGRQDIEKILDTWVSKSDGSQYKARLIAKEKILNCYKARDPKLNLSRLGLTSLPDIFPLFADFLTALDLSGNSLVQVSEEIVQLSNLSYLNLSHNPISFLPQQMNQLISLEQLDVLGMNRLEKIPLSIGNMEKLLCRWDLSEKGPVLTEQREGWLSIAKNVLVYGDRFTLFTVDKKLHCSGESPYPKLFPPKSRVEEVRVPVEGAVPRLVLETQGDRARFYNDIESYFD